MPFQIGSEKTAVASSARSALPTILSFRHLVKFSGLDDNKRKKILNCLDNYRSFLTKKLETEWDPVDPRKLEEQSNAYELSLGLSSKVSTIFFRTSIIYVTLPFQNFDNKRLCELSLSLTVQKNAIKAGPIRCVLCMSCSFDL